MDSTIVVKDQLLHFSHHHPLNLLHLQPSKHREENDDDDEEDDFVEEDNHGGQCNLCNEQIWSFHSCYYHCESCDYSLHKFCAELPESTQDHPLHIGHTLTLSMSCPDKAINYQIVGPEWLCYVCNLEWESTYNYYCSICNLGMDIICATLQHQTINHPSHPHQLERMSGHIISKCLACNNKHEGVFFHCATCRSLRFNLDCLLLPAKLLIQNHTNGSFIHSHPLTLAYSFPYSEYKDISYPPCRVCDVDFYAHLWVYKCDKCLYYVHVDCATSQEEPFMSIFLLKSRGKTSKNFKEDEHPNMLHCPFHDEGDNVLKHYMFDQKKFISSQHDGEMLNHFSHQHPLILTYKQTLVGEKLVSLHDPMKRVQLLCDGCVKPIMTVPFYICFQCADEQCCFVLHEWCAKLPTKIEEYDGHPQHTLFLLSKIPGAFFDVFKCSICFFPSNGFAYGCTMCEYYVDINCAFIPKEITHDSHNDHILSKVNPSNKHRKRYCIACKFSMKGKFGFHCRSCDFYIHVQCAFFLPKIIKHKCDKHPLSLRYEPVENQLGEYFCEVCENKFSPRQWFYHCTTCLQSMHAACAPLILQYELATYDSYRRCIYKFLNIKFGGSLKINDHSHCLVFAQGLERDGDCNICLSSLQYEMVFKCLECHDFACHYECA